MNSKQSFEIIVNCVITALNVVIDDDNKVIKNYLLNREILKILIHCEQHVEPLKQRT